MANRNWHSALVQTHKALAQAAMMWMDNSTEAKLLFRSQDWPRYGRRQLPNAIASPPD
jgi:hypothetical protein